MCVELEVSLGIRQLRSQLGPLQASREQLPASATVAPRDALLLLTRGERGYLGGSARWGLVGGFLDRLPPRPPLALDSAGLAEMPFYGRLLKTRRAVVPVSALVVESGRTARRQRWRIARADGRALLLAAIHDQHAQAGATCALLDAPAPPALAARSARLPLLIDEENCAAWFADDAERPLDDVLELLRARPWPPLSFAEIVEPPPSPQLAFAFA